MPTWPATVQYDWKQRRSRFASVSPDLLPPTRICAWLNIDQQSTWCISLTIYPRLDDGMDVSQENGPWHPDPGGRGIVPLSSFRVFLRRYWPTGTQGVPSVSKATWVYFGVWVRLTNHKRHRENVNARCGATLNASPVACAAELDRNRLVQNYFGPSTN
jgi:hypothetical protein